MCGASIEGDRRSGSMMKAESHATRTTLFHLALGLVILGAAFLAWTTKSLSRSAQLWPFVALWLGMAAAYHSMNSQKKFRVLFPAITLALVALVVLVALFARLHLRDYWPLFVIAAGLGLSLSGWFSYHRLNAGYLVPSLAFILLGCIFLIFSFGFSSMSFRMFISRWWPTLFLAAGIILFVLYFLMKALGPVAKKGGDGQ